METVNSIAQAAAKAVWGENTTDGKEPISGAQGDPSKGEPFDKGNLEGMLNHRPSWRQAIKYVWTW
jgi:hypothetical protein